MTYYAKLDHTGRVLTVYADPADTDIQVQDLTPLPGPINWAARPTPKHAPRLVSGEIVWADTRTVAEARAAKNAQINAWRSAADSRFEYGGKWFQVDAASWQQISGTQGYVAEFGGFYPGFPGAWKAEDNSFLPIPDLATWRAFFAAVIARGTANFMQSEAAKTALAAAETVSEIDAVPLPSE